MRIVVLQREVLEAEGEQVFHGRVDAQGRQCARFAGELEFRLLARMSAREQFFSEFLSLAFDVLHDSTSSFQIRTRVVMHP